MNNKLGLGQSVPAWLVQFIYRVLMLRAPGVYEMILIVRDDNTRCVVIKNPSQPYRLEELGDEPDGE